ncbi:hypothetical protein ACFQX6_45210 [Streptosporangium lutulentum]
MVRLLEEGMFRTMEYQPNRLNLTTDGAIDGSTGTGTVIEADNG